MSVSLKSALVSEHPVHAESLHEQRAQEVRKRKRLMKRAAKLSSDDLLKLCVMKGVASQRDSSDAAASGSASSAGASDANPPARTPEAGAGNELSDRDPE